LSKGRRTQSNPIEGNPNMTTFAEDFQQHLENDETFEQVADWYFSEANNGNRIAHNTKGSREEAAFFDWLNEVVFTEALEQTRAMRAKRLARRATDLAGRS
jgi:hypothetical protein